MQLSKRMQMIANMVKPSAVVADIGTDHGYIPIWLAKNRIAQHVIAADVRKGPLARAQEHISESGLEDRIELRLGNGLHVLSPGEAERIIIAGMGGLLMIQILSDCPDIAAKAEELILSPQSDIDSVRKYLHQAGFCIEAEDMTEEEGKYYTVMRCRPGTDCTYLPEDYLFGRDLIEKAHPVLLDYLHKKAEKTEQIMEQLSGMNTEKCQKRIAEMDRERTLITDALTRMKRSMKQ